MIVIFGVDSFVERASIFTKIGRKQKQKAFNIKFIFVFQVFKSNFFLNHFELTEVDPYNWSQFTACSTTCGVGLSSRYRLCSQGNCANDGYETQQVPCYQPKCPGKKKNCSFC